MGPVVMNWECMESVIRIAPSSNNTLIDGEDELYLIIGQSSTEEKMNIKHYIVGGRNVEERWVDKDYLVSSVVSGGGIAGLHNGF